MNAMSKSAPAHPGGVAQTLPLCELVNDLTLEAMGFIAKDRVESVVRQWVARGNGDPSDIVFVPDLLALAVELALVLPSASGATAFDRLARARPPADARERTALDALRQARFRIVRIAAEPDRALFQLDDIATGECLQLRDEAIGSAAIGAVVIGRIAWLGDEGLAFVGPVMPLDPAALEIAHGFMRRDGRGLSNAVRCAEAVYKHIARNGTPHVPGLNDPPDSDPEVDGLPFGPETSELDELAFAWAERGDAEPDADDVQQARDLTRLDVILDALVSAVVAAEARREPLAKAYRQITLIQLETLQRRAASGMSATTGISSVAAAVDGAVRNGEIPPQVRAVFEDLRRQVEARRSGRASDAELERLIGRIRALRAKTVEQGCTEKEALAAAEKVAELLDRHGLSMSELELQKQDCEGVGIETGRRRVGPVDECVPTIAAFFDLRSWVEKTSSGTLRHIFFGLPGDVEAASYLYELVERAFDTETALFRAGAFYASLLSGDRRSATNSFQIGLTTGIRAKLDELRQAREAVLRSGSGRDLVLVKDSIVEDEVAKLGLHLRSRTRAKKRYVLSDAFDAGHQAGKQFEYRAGLQHRA